MATLLQWKCKDFGNFGQEFGNYLQLKISRKKWTGTVLFECPKQFELRVQLLKFLLPIC
jgi:hypothetical protein